MGGVSGRGPEMIKCDIFLIAFEKIMDAAPCKTNRSRSQKRAKNKRKEVSGDGGRTKEL